MTRHATMENLQATAEELRNLVRSVEEKLSYVQELSADPEHEAQVEKEQDSARTFLVWVARKALSLEALIEQHQSEARSNKTETLATCTRCRR